LKSRLATVWNSVDTEVFKPTENRLQNGSLRLLGVGRISPQKNLSALAPALAECRRKNLRVTLDWAGKTDDPACHRAVLSAIENHRVRDVWRWLGVCNDIPALLRQYDALVLPSLWEGLPNVVCEALAAGLPVLASDVSDNVRLVHDGVSGFLFDPEEPETIARAITQFAGLDQQTRINFGRAARAFAEKELSLSACVAAYERLIVADRREK
jgi:glycosyltransferase involved in cell wall biosynthesis